MFKNFNWIKAGLVFFGFALALAVYDMFTAGRPDMWKIIGIPAITILLITLIDRSHFTKPEER